MAPTPRFPLKKMPLQQFFVRTAASNLLLLASVVSPAVLAAASEMSANDFKDARALDWVPIADLTEDQKKKVPVTCCGAYIPPERNDAEVNIIPNQAPLRAFADEETTDHQTTIVFKGNVSIIQGSRSIVTDTATFDKTTNRGELTGGIQLRDPGVMVSADTGVINKQTNEAVFDNARFVLYETRVHGVADHLHKFGDNIVQLEKSEISSCEPGDNAWSIKGSEISLHPDEHYGTAENMRVNIKDIPVVYLPYVRFPLGKDRLTGFLTPMPGYSSRNGYELSVPFYWNIAPDTDATITPHYMSRRGYMFEGDIRHLSTYFETDLKGSFIKSDHGGYSSYLESEIALGHLTEEQAYPYRGHDRWTANFDQNGGRGEAWSTKINYTDISDKDFLRDMYNGSVDSNRQAFIRQMASADYRAEHWFMGIKADEYRLLTTTQLPYRELPRIHADGNYQANDWVFTLNNEYVDFVQNSYLDSSNASAETLANIVYGERFNTDYRVTWDKSVVWGFFKPSLAVKSLSYHLDEANLSATANAAPHFVAPQASIDTGLYFERDTDIFNGTYLQTLEPRLFYFYSKRADQSDLYQLTPNGKSYVNFDSGDLTFNYNQLFRTTRFAGGDRLDDANQLSLALSTAFSSPMTGVERLRISVGQIIYNQNRDIMIYDRSVTDPSILNENTRSTSDWAAQVSGQVSSRVHVSADAAYDDRTGKLDNANAGLHYMDNSYRIFNLTYRYTLKPLITNPSQVTPVTIASLNQLDSSIVLPLNTSWSLIARNIHDFTHSVELDTFAGLEYNDCCYRVRLMGRRELRVDYTTPEFFSRVTNKDFEPSIMLEIELKGLGSLDKKISNLLEKTVVGFKDREKLR